MSDVDWVVPGLVGVVPYLDHTAFIALRLWQLCNQCAEDNDCVLESRQNHRVRISKAQHDSRLIGSFPEYKGIIAKIIWTDDDDDGGDV